jgi:hypothetical protein
MRALKLFGCRNEKPATEHAEFKSLLWPFRYCEAALGLAPLSVAAAFQPERPSLWLFRIGCVIREQRPATATTRTNPARGWSSRPRPVTRLQATGQPRRVMRGGSKTLCAWLQIVKRTHPDRESCRFHQIIKSYETRLHSISIN